MRGRPLAARVGAASALLSLLAFVLGVTVLPRPFETVDLVVYRGGAANAAGDLYIATYGRFSLPFTYPPVAALLFRPLLLLPFPLVQVLWTAAGVAALAAAVLLVVRAVGARLGPGLALLAVLLWLEPVQNTLAYGQVNLLLLLAVLYDVALRPGRRTEGALLGVAVAVKLTPAIFVLYLLARGRYRAAATAVGVAVGLTLAGWAVLPAQSRAYWFGAVLDPGRPGASEFVGNQSLRGTLVRLLDGEAAALPWLLLTPAVAAGGILLAAAVAGRRGEVLGTCLAALVGLLVSPVSWSHHYVWVAVLVAALLVTPPPRRTPADRRLGAGLLLLFLTQPIWWLPARDGREFGYGWWQELLGASYVLAALATLVILGVVRGQAPDAGTVGRCPGQRRGRADAGLVEAPRQSHQ